MDRATLERRFLKTTKQFAKYVGIWPNQNKIVKVLLWAMVDISMLTSIVVQTARVIHIGTLEVVIEQSSLLGATMLMIVKHSNYVLNATKLESLLNDMSDDWSTNRLKEEFQIMTMYANRGNFLVKIYAVSSCISVAYFLQLPWSPRLIHMLRHQNTSPPFIYSIPGYYFIEDNREYFYYIQLHVALCLFVVLVVFISCDTFYILFVQHGCGLLTVAGYRFKNGVRKNSSITKYTETKGKEIHENIWHSIQGHQRAITFLEKIEDTHVTYLFLTMIIIVVILSITMVQVTTMEVCFEFYKYIGFMFVQVLHLSFLTLQGQFVTNSSDEIYNAIYEALWYNTHPKMQVLHVLALRRSLTPPRLTAGGLIELNMESLSGILKLCVSYYTVLRSA